MPEYRKVPSEDAVLVETGSFRIDQKRALRKLKKFQWPDKLPRWIPLLRCAHVAGAKGLRINTSMQAVDAFFDGKGFTRRELRDPFGALFEGERHGDPRRVYLAQALLASLKLSPETLELTSGPAGNRHTLRLHSLESFELVRARPGSGTRLRMRFSLLRGGYGTQWLYGYLPDRQNETIYAIGYLEEMAGMSRVGVTIDGTRLKPEPDPGHADHLFDAGGIRGRLSVPAYLRPDESRVSLHAHGVRFGTARFKPRYVKLVGAVNCDAFKLNISQTGIVKDETYTRVLEALERESERCLAQVAARHRKRMARAGMLLLERPAARNLWEQRFRWGPGVKDSLWLPLKNAVKAMFLGRSRLSSEDRADLFETARLTIWLRDAAKRATFSEEARQALRNAPVYFDSAGRPLSPADLGLPDPKVELRCCLRPIMEPAQPPVIWCVSWPEAFRLKRRFGGRVRMVNR